MKSRKVSAPSQIDEVAVFGIVKKVGQQDFAGIINLRH